MKQNLLILGLLLMGSLAALPVAEASSWHVNIGIGTSPYPYYVVPVYYAYPAVYYPVYYPSYYPAVVSPVYTYYSLPSYAVGPTYVTSYGPSYIVYN